MSLLDDPGVLAGLEDLEPGQPRGSAASDPAFHASIHALDSGLADLSSTLEGDELSQFASEPSELLDDDPVDEELHEAAVDWKTLVRSYSGVWLFCGSLGAAAAALLFHAEVARLMWQWSGAVTSSWP